MLRMRETYFYSELFRDGCQCWRPDVPNCGPGELAKKKNHFEEDLDDIANSLMKVMCICRLNPWEVKLTKNLIKRSFRHYEQLRYRIDRVPDKRFNKENFLHDLAVEAGMNRMDSQLAYGITKRAFRAYYHGTGEDGQRLEKLAKQMRHRSECLWLHAAKRTAEIYAVYAGLMYSEQQQYEQCFQCVYKALYEELQSRLQYDDSKALPICVCEPANAAKPQKSRVQEKPSKSPWEVVKSKISASNISGMTTEIFFTTQVLNISQPTSATSMHAEYVLVSVTTSQRSITSKKAELSAKPSAVISYRGKTLKRKRKKKKIVKCKCPQMQCNRERLTPMITAECSQGPYICRWVNYNEQEEQFKEHRVPFPPLEVICSPCVHEDESCDDECTCTCEFCHCSSAYIDVEEQHAEPLSKTGVEDRDTDYCWLAPFRSSPRVEKETTELSVEEEEVDPDACVCMCEYKRRGQPHLFTYLAPFKGNQPPPVEEPVKEPVRPKEPPCGISWETYRCWNEPEVDNDERTVQACKECPYITLLSAVHNPPSSKAADLDRDITIKSQHYASSGKNQQSTKRSSIIIKRNTIAGQENPKPIQSGTQNKPTPKPNATPAAAKPPATTTAPANAQDDDKLTKEDVLQMFGLNK